LIQSPLQNLLTGLQLNQRNGMPSPQAKIKLNAREREVANHWKMNRATEPKL
jgi:hypothetical protein